jgi:uncharacterized protein
MTFTRNLLLFGRILRRAGLGVHHGRMLDAIRALDLVGVRHRADVQAALAALLVHRREDLARFDAAFDLFFRSKDPSAPRVRRVPHRDAPDEAAPARSPAMTLEMPTAGESDAPDERLVGAYSAYEVLRTKDFAALTAQEIDRARDILAHLPWELGTRRTRRWRRASGGAVDLRPVIRRMATRGEAMVLPRRQRTTAPRPLVVLADVSGSMERYSRMLLHFV